MPPTVPATVAPAAPNDPMMAQQTSTQNPLNPEDFWQPIYDRVNYPVAGVSSLSFFTNPRGQNATLIRNGVAASVQKTWRDTNLETASVIPTKLFKVIGLSFAMYHLTQNLGTNSADRRLIQENGYCKWDLVDKRVLVLPLSLIPELNPITGAATTANNTTTSPGGVGIGINPIYKLPVEITINPFENFSFVFDFDGPPVLSNTMDLQPVLQAFMRRPT